jgi:hypothetical protein
MDRPMFVQAEPPRQLREAVGAGIIAHSLFLGLILLIGSLIPERVYQARVDRGARTWRGRWRGWQQESGSAQEGRAAETAGEGQSAGRTAEA